MKILQSNYLIFLGFLALSASCANSPEERRSLTGSENRSPQIEEEKASDQIDFSAVRQEFPRGVTIKGTIQAISKVEADGADVIELELASPSLNAFEIQSASVLACTGPSVDACAAFPMKMVSLDAPKEGSSIEVFGVVSKISISAGSTYYKIKAAQIR